jgi:hypothetical protein
MVQVQEKTILLLQLANNSSKYFIPPPPPNPKFINIFHPSSINHSSPIHLSFHPIINFFGKFAIFNPNNDFIHHNLD